MRWSVFARNENTWAITRHINCIDRQQLCFIGLLNFWSNRSKNHLNDNSLSARGWSSAMAKTSNDFFRRFRFAASFCAFSYSFSGVNFVIRKTFALLLWLFSKSDENIFLYHFYHYLNAKCTYRRRRWQTMSFRACRVVCTKSEIKYIWAFIVEDNQVFRLPTTSWKSARCHTYCRNCFMQLHCRHRHLFSFVFFDIFSFSRQSKQKITTPKTSRLFDVVMANLLWTSSTSSFILFFLRFGFAFLSSCYSLTMTFYQFHYQLIHT